MRRVRHCVTHCCGYKFVYFKSQNVHGVSDTAPYFVFLRHASYVKYSFQVRVPELQNFSIALHCAPDGTFYDLEYTFRVRHPGLRRVRNCVTFGCGCNFGCSLKVRKSAVFQTLHYAFVFQGHASYSKCTFEVRIPELRSFNIALCFAPDGTFLI